MSKRTKIITGLIIGVVLLSGVCFKCFSLYRINKIVTTLTMDINLSIKIGLNYKNEIVKVEGLNEDGKELLKDKELKGSTLETAIEDITESVIEKGYITEKDNHILINVTGSDIREEVVTLINNEFKEKNTQCNVIAQEINEEAKENAEKYGISESKASYIESIIKENEGITFEELKDMSINEINQVVREKEEQKQPEEDKKEEEKDEVKPEEDKQNNSSSNSNSSSSSSNNSSTTKPNKKPVLTPPAIDDRTGAWCDFFAAMPLEGGVEYETPGHISDTGTYAEAAKKYTPDDTYWGEYYVSITSYKTASYCGAGIVEVENYDKTKTYTMYLDSVTLELLEFITTEIEKPLVDEAAAKVIVAGWLLNTYNVDINSCDWENFYYAVQYDPILNAKIPEWQYTCKIEETTTYYAVTVNGRTGALSTGYTWSN